MADFLKHAGHSISWLYVGSDFVWPGIGNVCEFVNSGLLANVKIGLD